MVSCEIIDFIISMLIDPERRSGLFAEDVAGMYNILDCAKNDLTGSDEFILKTIITMIF